jgi:hypothetical protein
MSTKNTPSHTTAAASGAAPATGPRSRRRKTIAIVGVAASIVIVLVIASDPSRRPLTDVSAHPATPAPVIDTTADATEMQPPSRPISKARRADHTAATAARTAANTASVPAGSAVTTPGTTLSSPTSLPPTTAAAAPAAAATVASAQPPVTITGCLEMTTDGREFRLTDTEGDNAPKSRAWRSGFLKNRPSAVELLSPPDPLALRKYVGHRVTATGMLDDRALSMRSFAPAGAACD